MASLRKLRRRALRWQRYAEKTYWHPRNLYRCEGSRTHHDADQAVIAELKRRRELHRLWPVCPCGCGSDHSEVETATVVGGVL